MGVWNYRVVRSKEADGTHYYTIREAYYNQPNAEAPWSVSANDVYPGGATLVELRKDVALMFAAFDKPPLDEDSLTDLLDKRRGQED